jgi:sugar phosphate isomerase/epimerase
MAGIAVGLSMLHCLGEPFSSLCQRLSEVTVEYVELVDDGWHALDQKRVQTLKDISKDRGLTYTLHAPFASINIAAPADDVRAFMLKRVERSMAFAQRLECRLMVIHPGLQTGISSFYPGLDWTTNLESVKQLLRMSKEYGVEIAIENCPEPFGFLTKSVEQFSRFFRELGENIGLVLDVGHSNINGQTHDFINSFGSRLVHVHAHDNDGIHDLHLGVGHGTVDWQRFSEAIKAVGFKGIVMLESCFHLEESLERLQTLLR